MPTLEYMNSLQGQKSFKNRSKVNKIKSPLDCYKHSLKNEFLKDNLVFKNWS